MRRLIGPNAPAALQWGSRGARAPKAAPQRRRRPRAQAALEGRPSGAPTAPQLRPNCARTTPERRPSAQAPRRRTCAVPAAPQSLSGASAGPSRHHRAAPPSGQAAPPALHTHTHKHVAQVDVFWTPIYRGQVGIGTLETHVCPEGGGNQPTSGAEAQGENPRVEQKNRRHRPCLLGSQRWANSEEMLQHSHQCWSFPRPIWSSPAQVRSMLVELGPSFCRSSWDSDQICSKFGQRSRLVEIGPVFDRSGPSLVASGHAGRIRPVSGHVWPIPGLVRQMLAKFGQNRSNRPKIGQLPSFGNLGIGSRPTSFDEIRSQFGKVRPTFGQIWAISSDLGRDSACIPRMCMVMVPGL